MIVLGIDPGKHTGIAVLELRGTQRPRWIAGETVEQDQVSDWLKAYRPELVVVETPKSIHRAQANVHLIATAILAGEYRAMAEGANYRAIAISPEQWRASLIGVFRKGKIDGRVKEMLERIVEGLPSTNNHVRDAAGAAIVGANRAARRVA